MIGINFISTNNFDLENFKDLENFTDAYPDFQHVVLKNEQELDLLLKLIGIEMPVASNMKNSDFEKYWNISEFKFQEFKEGDFEAFYKKWIEYSGRENNMDEFGSLLFLKIKSSIWNLKSYRIIIKEL
ncbi:hypothetical protein [Tenacibaculum sp. 190524A05c]|uniref:hypothetical protein n=1 Tax=Tenacibaculum platacis TaxID=3137852 RepID=UPI0031FAB72C